MELERLQISRLCSMPISAVKQQLKAKIKTSRKQKGLGDIIVNKEQKKTELTELDIERQERRKASNRKAARKLRENNLRKQEAFEVEFRRVQQENQDLKYQLEVVRAQRFKAEARLKNHLITCPVQAVPVRGASLEGSPMLGEDTVPLTPASFDVPSDDVGNDLSMYGNEDDGYEMLQSEAHIINNTASCIDIKPLLHTVSSPTAETSALQHMTATVDISALQQGSSFDSSESNVLHRANGGYLLPANCSYNAVTKSLPLQRVKTEHNTSISQTVPSMISAAIVSNTDMSCVRDLEISRSLQRISTAAKSAANCSASAETTDNNNNDNFTFVTSACCAANTNAILQHTTASGDCSKSNTAILAPNFESTAGEFDSIDSDTSVNLSQITPTIGVDVTKQDYY